MLPRLYRSFALRILLASLAALVIMAGITLAVESERIDRASIALAMDEANTFARRYRDSLGPADDAGRAMLTQHLERFLESRDLEMDGHFLVAEIYDHNRHTLAEAALSGGGRVEKAFEALPHRFTNPDEKPLLDKVILGKELFLRIVTPIAGPDGRAAYFEGIYQVEETRLEEIRGRMMQTVLIVLGGSITTTLFLLPAVITFNRHLVTLSERLLRTNIDTLTLLGTAIAKRDSDTGSHNYRVTLYAVRLAEAAGLPAATIRALIKGAFLHDVGKIAIRDAILLKPGKLTPEEFEEMKTHVGHGGDIIARAAWLEDAAPMVCGHHEKYDGTGYPRGVAGNDIPVAARVFAIADVFDALTSRRPYKEPFPFDRATAMLAEQGGRHFDPALLSTFLGIAAGLYDAYGVTGDAALEAELESVTRRYFTVA